MPQQPTSHSQSISQHYHQRTKYHPDTLAKASHPLDFSQQPTPAKHYPIGVQVDLRPYLESMEAPEDPQQAQLYRLSRLLYLSYGITGVVPFPDNPFYLRSAPSAGGLYPAEIYLLVRNHDFLPAGLYNYQVQDHGLCRFWDSYLWSDLEAACLWHPVLPHCGLALVITAVFERSAWRYRDRAYRRIFLDSGHLLGNLELAANLQDYRVHLIGGFEDERLNDLLYLDEAQEGAVTVAALADLLDIQQNLALAPTALPSLSFYDYPDIPDGELLRYCHRATAIRSREVTYANPAQPERNPSAWGDKYNFPFGLKISVASPPLDWGEGLRDLTQTLLRRRSTRRYSGASIHLDELAALLNFTYHPEDYRDQLLEESPDYFDLSLVETFLAVIDVRGLESGCYYYAVQAQELRQIRFKNFRQELHYLCLQQELGRDAAVVVFHTADLHAAIAAYGDRAYRYLHLDAGHLGQRLNLAATQLQLGVSGIGGFFDDQVNDLLGIPVEEAVLYVTTLGQPYSG
ncbi:SagB/ThcOx family dehydrogenase [Lyngbya confervoides]|uniref:SagB/ThcOx family dehydrogenase n=1 Tax=Lyngbya confervoides BDU141951 TaxID=1574623 RepID=A0ABD4T2G9_9CYAN|nr:SagB/ThcOx family dehydrogenase [Lyngbya confervoides]MCM1982635.1 SagB/ThcOx family dehydrogenase [Lyngbya confervoides BDU141951]